MFWAAVVFFVLHSDKKENAHIVPRLDDNDSTIHAYLDKAFPTFVKDLSVIPKHELICISEPREYMNFPCFKTAYKNIDNIKVGYTSTRGDWEPYEWLFSQISWTTSATEQACTYCELAIAAHVLTGGATAIAQDLATKVKCMDRAFKKYHQKCKLPEGLPYGKFFKPNNSINT